MHLPISRHVGVLVETDDTWGRNVVKAIARYAKSAGWTLLIGPRDSQRRLRLPRRWAGDGVIVSLRDAATARHVWQVGAPAVDVSITMPNEVWLGRVATDDHLRAELAFEHFRERGLENFACYAPPIGRYPDGRAQAFAHVAMHAGYNCNLFTRAKNRPDSSWLADYGRATKWLAGLQKPVAVFASDAYPARQLCEVCDRNGVKIPDEVAILSGDTDDLLCEAAWPQISSVELASHRIGEEACELLDELMAGKPVPSKPKLIQPLRVLARHSTDILAVDDIEFAMVLRAIRTRAVERIEIRDLLREFPISRRSLEIKFKRYLGRTPAAEIRRVRLEHARMLLLETDRSIESIANACSISSGSALSHLFRKHLGITPGQLRSAR